MAIKLRSLELIEQAIARAKEEIDEEAKVRAQKKRRGGAK